MRRANGRNKSRQCCANNVACCLRPCCRGFKQMQQLRKNRNNMQQGVKKDATCNIQQCCVRLCTGVLISLDVTCCVRLHTLKVHPVARCCTLLRRIVGSCCAKFETRKTFSYVQTDATTFNIAGRPVSVCT